MILDYTYRLILIKSVNPKIRDYEVILESFANQTYPSIENGDFKYTKEVKEFIV